MSVNVRRHASVLSVPSDKLMLGSRNIFQFLITEAYRVLGGNRNVKFRNLLSL